jgi:hypothetical protein
MSVPAGERERIRVESCRDFKEMMSIEKYQELRDRS